MGQEKDSIAWRIMGVGLLVLALFLMKRWARADDICEDTRPCPGVLSADNIIPPVKTLRIGESDVRRFVPEPLVAIVNMSDDYETMTVDLAREICTVPNSERPSGHSRLKRIRIKIDSGVYEVGVICIGESVQLSPKGWVKQ